MGDSSVDPVTGVSGGTWMVSPSNNTWGFDNVGYPTGLVMYYRQNGRAPCGSTVWQQMTMQCGDGSFQAYGPVNLLGETITNTTVSSGRAANVVGSGGSIETRRY
jgi:hypothetical protein